jgi:asparagine synthetase B (glutamine-hydrolysing)
MLATEIIPSKPIYHGIRDNIDLKAVAIFAATGFFLDQDTYYEEQKVLRPGHNYDVDENIILDKGPYFSWTYNPSNRKFSDVVDEFQVLFETIIKEQSYGQKVILPLSGGLDSRTQAAALKRVGAEVSSYSYQFQNGFPEAEISREIAKKQGFDFRKFEITPGYLWDYIDDLAVMNGCYSEFTHPRQLAVFKEMGNLGDVFSLGHWGDVLFDDMGVPEDLSFQGQVDLILKKIIKKGGLELGEALWKDWQLEGTLFDYLRSRVEGLLTAIDIPHSANARIRAFKSLYWAPRWTSVNLSVFESIKPIYLPYYDNRICDFITRIPEEYLSKRKIQIEYLKRYAPQLAKITWQEQKPFNLFNYRWNKGPYNIPYRLLNKAKRRLSSRRYIQRNWELQFLGSDNESRLEGRLFAEPSDFISKELVQNFYHKFKNEDAVRFSHSVSMLLTLKTWEKLQKG